MYSAAPVPCIERDDCWEDSAWAGTLPSAITSASQGGDTRGDRNQLTTRWTTELNGRTRSNLHWLSPFRVRHRKPDGFVILPAAFSGGRLSRDAWRAVKSCLSSVRTSHHPPALAVRAVSLRNASWVPETTEGKVPIGATWIEVWRTIHRVHGIGVLQHGRRASEDPLALGVSVEPVKAARCSVNGWKKGCDGLR
jgi:hypothetical protein